MKPVFDGLGGAVDTVDGRRGVYMSAFLSFVDTFLPLTMRLLRVCAVSCFLGWQHPLHPQRAFPLALPRVDARGCFQASVVRG